MMKFLIDYILVGGLLVLLLTQVIVPILFDYPFFWVFKKNSMLNLFRKTSIEVEEKATLEEIKKMKKTK
jgi:hypothetical protein